MVTTIRLPQLAAVSCGYRSPINNGTNIIGLLSMPEFTDLNSNAMPSNLQFGGYSNHVVAYVRSLSGPAVEKPPQNNDIIVGDSFTYRILCVNAPIATAMPPIWQSGSTYNRGDQVLWNWMCWQAVNSGVNSQPPSVDWARLPYSPALSAALHEVRLTFLWPQLPNGSLGAGRQTFRTMVAGQMTQIFTNGQWLYFYQPQSFTNVVSAQ